jgi:hypothetical protein
MNSGHFIWMLIPLGMCFLLPLAAIVAWAVIESKKARLRHDERLAMIERGIPPSDAPAPRSRDASPVEIRADVRVGPLGRRRDPAPLMGWAVGLLVAGVMLMLPDRFELGAGGIVLTAVGAAFLTRGIIGMRRETARSGESK